MVDLANFDEEYTTLHKSLRLQYPDGFKRGQLVSLMKMQRCKLSVEVVLRRLRDTGVAYYESHAVGWRFK